METYIFTKEHDAQFYNSLEGVTLDRVDKNGTHHYIDRKCPRCGGTGWLDCYEYIDGGRCFQCHGSGRSEHEFIVRTPEYEEKLRQRRAAKIRREAPAKNAEFLRRIGMNEDGECWIVLGDTYAIKDALKEAGAKYGAGLGWHFDHPVDEFPVVKISKDTEVAPETPVLRAHETGLLSFEATVSELEQYRGWLNERWQIEHAPKTEWFGSVGDKIELHLKLIKIGSYETQFGWTYVNTFVDEAGNQFVWKTGTVAADIDETVLLRGTIKEHSEYRGIKQTVLTRCKVIERVEQ